MKKMPLTHALMWIVGSCYLTTGGTFFFLRQSLLPKPDYDNNTISYIIQTGPQQQALPTEYLAELMELSFEHKQRLDSWDEKIGLQKLLASPLIASATLAKRYPGTLYVDYIARQPVAAVYDIENTAVDKDGFLLPLYPFFSPKNLPEIYFGFQNFGRDGTALFMPEPMWNKSLKTGVALLAFDILTLLKPYHNNFLKIIRIDVSQAGQKSLGTQEIVVIVEYNSSLACKPFYHYVRLTTLHYRKEIDNYLELVKTMIAKEERSINEDQVVDMRIDQLALISDMSR